MGMDDAGVVGCVTDGDGYLVDTVYGSNVGSTENPSPCVTGTIWVGRAT